MFYRLCLVASATLTIQAALLAAPIVTVGNAGYDDPGISPLQLATNQFTFGNDGSARRFTDSLSNVTTLSSAQAAIASNFNLTLTTLNSDGSGAGILSDTMGGDVFTLTFPTSPFTPGGIVTFQFLNAPSTAIAIDAGNLTVNGRVRLIGNTTGVDFGATFGEWRFVPTIIVTADSGPPFTIVPTGGPDKGSLTINSDNVSTALVLRSTGNIVDQSGNPLGDPIPEPMTLATFGALALFGGLAARRKLKAKADAVAAA